MPEIQLTNHPNDIGWIRSIMHFPNEEALRDQNYAVEITKFELEDIDYLAEKWSISKSLELDIPLNAECIKLLSEAPADSELKAIRFERTKRGIVAGHILSSLYLMNKFELEEPSLNKSIYVSKEIAKKAKYSDGSPMYSETKIKQYWKEYMPVAHFWAALEINQIYSFVPNQEDCFSEKGFALFLQVASGIYEFGIKFIPKRAKIKQPFLDPLKCWILDSNIIPIHLVSDIKPDGLIKILKKYKVPISNN